MGLSWLAEMVFFGAYAIGYFVNQTLPHDVWSLLTAIAAAVVAVLLLVSNGQPYIERNRVK